MSDTERLLEPGRLFGGALVDALLRERLRLTELAPGQWLGAYRITAELGRGGMGIVYLARRADGAYQQEVAIKWLPVGETAARAIEQFRRERQILADLRHPHIARLLDGGCSEDGHLWFAMEHVDGLSVDQHVRHMPSDWRARVRLLLPIIEAVQFAHAHLLVHRDIKPGNVLIDADGRAVLVDFGIAALLRGIDADRAYTDGHASPEQCAGARPDIRADVWQLGHLLQHVLDIADGDGHVPRRPRDLDAILAHATAAEPAQRYPTAAALQADLERLLGHRPVSVRRPGPWHRLQLLARAHPWGMLASMLTVLLFAVTSAGFMWRLARQRDLARHAQHTAEAVNAFLEDDLLPGADPLQVGSGNIPVADMIERGLSRVEPRLKHSPKVAAQVELSLGRILAHLGHFRRAEHAYDLAIGHLTALYGAHDARVLDARLQLARYAIEPARLATAGPRLEQLRRDVLRSLGPQATLLARVDIQLAHAAYLRGDYRQCTQRYHALLPRLHDLDPVLRADAYTGLSLCDTRLGHDQDALDHARAAVALVSEALGPDHPYTLESKLALDAALMSAGRYTTAVHVLSALVPAFAHRYGRTHPITLRAMHDLGYAFVCQGHPERGVTWLQRAVAGRRQALGRDHPWTALSEALLGLALIQQHQLPRAASVLASAEATVAHQPHTSTYVREAVRDVQGDLALAQGHAHLALTDYTAALAMVRKLYPPTQPRIAVLELSRALALHDAGHPRTSLLLLRAALARLGTRPDCRPAQRARAHRLLESHDHPH